VSQLALPYRIALIGLLAVVAVWFVLLRPGGAEDQADAPLTAAPASEQSASTSAPPAAAKAPAATSSAPRAARSVPADASDPSSSLLSAVAGGDVGVLVFATKGAADDAEVVRAARAVRGPGVDVRIAAIEDVARYRAVTAGVRVVQSPTVLVIAPGGRARAIVGLTSEPEIRQLVEDQRRAR
jgi:hypothetical protein